MCSAFIVCIVYTETACIPAEPDRAHLVSNYLPFGRMSKCVDVYLSPPGPLDKWSTPLERICHDRKPRNDSRAVRMLWSRTHRHKYGRGATHQFTELKNWLAPSCCRAISGRSVERGWRCSLLLATRSKIVYRSRSAGGDAFYGNIWAGPSADTRQPTCSAREKRAHQFDSLNNGIRRETVLYAQQWRPKLHNSMPYPLYGAQRCKSTGICVGYALLITYIITAKTSRNKKMHEHRLHHTPNAIEMNVRARGAMEPIVFGTWTP